MLKGLPKFNDLFSQKPQSVLGVDVGSSSIKIVQLRKEKERAILETYGELSTGPYGGLEIGQSAGLVEEKVVEILKDLIKESGARAIDCAIAIPIKSSFVTVIELPEMDESQVGPIIQLEARRYIPVPLTEVEIDWWVIPEEEIATEEITQIGVKSIAERKKKTKVLLIAIHKDTITKYKNIVSGSALVATPGSFEIETFSVIRSSLSQEMSPTLIIDIGAATAKMAIVDRGIMRLSYSVSRGSQDITSALSKSLNISFSRAEEMKREIGISEAPEHKEMLSVISPNLEYIFSEANSVIINYQAKNKRVVNRVVLTGGGSLTKGLVDFAVKRLNIEVSLSDPFSRVAYPAFLQGALKDAGPSFAVAIGLALRKLQV